MKSGIVWMRCEEGVDREAAGNVNSLAAFLFSSVKEGQRSEVL